MLVTKRSRGVSTSVPLHAVVKATSRTEGGWRLKLIEGEQVDVSEVDWELAIEMTPVSMIPAQPGTFLVEKGVKASGEDHVYRTAVLGWATYYDLETRPVMLTSEALLNDKWAILFPDGRVERPHDGHTAWATLDDWLADEPEGA